MKYIAVLFLIHNTTNTFSQKVKNVSGEFQLKMESSYTIELAKQKACDYARVQAMEDEFGRVVFQGNSTMLENKQSGSKVETKSVFSMIADTHVNAEWIEDTEEPKVTKEFVKDELWVKCKVNGKARELTREKIDIKVQTMAIPDTKYKTTDFNNGQDLYLSFKSPKNGYVVIFLDDRKSAYCIYPYQNMPYEEYASFEFQAQTDYIFFSEKNKFKPSWTWVDHLQTSTESDYEQNRIFVLFSVNKINLPVLESAQKQSTGLSIPRSVSSEDFQRWVQKIRSKDDKMQLEIVDITIKKQ
ncbi:MAG: hypothetical protein NW207_09665 [Cytophagales bacterium]|nr:hypothetical protein [Cytophagales bacterium]